MKDTEATILEAIETAFDGVPRPATSLRQFWLTDERGMSGTITPEEWALAGQSRPDRQWQDLSEEHIEECGCQLAHMQADAFRYFLPAYMRYVVRHVRNEFLDNEINEFAIYGLMPSTQSPSYRAMQMAQVTPGEKSVVARFLEYVLEHADEYIRADACCAREFWLRA